MAKTHFRVPLMLEAAPKAHDVGCRGHHNPRSASTSIRTETSSTIIRMCAHSLEASVSGDILLQPLRGGHSPRCFVAMAMFLRLACFGRAHGNKFCGQHLHSGHSQQAPIQYESLQGYRDQGKSTMGWYVGFKLHLLCNEKRRTDQLCADTRQCG